MNDHALLAGALDRLKSTGEIAYRGEFGAEIATFVPFAAWLKREGHLEGRRLTSYRGMRPYYFFLDEDQFAERAEPRAWLAPEQRDWPTNASYTATRQRWHVFPDYRARYRDEGRRFDRPILFVQNKFCVEWRVGPINYLPLRVLERLFRLADDRYDIVYSRPRRMRVSDGYATDDNDDCDYPDLALARDHPHILVLEDHCAAGEQPYNLTKLQILGKSHMFVAVQGGGAHLLACFGRSLMLLYHREGQEYPHAYANGPYRYLSDPPPSLLVARTIPQLDLGIGVIEAARPEAEKITIPRECRPVIEELTVRNGR